jgi:hypothetical protein
MRMFALFSWFALLGERPGLLRFPTRGYIPKISTSTGHTHIKINT